MKVFIGMLPLAVLLSSCVAGGIDVDRACTEKTFTTVPAGTRIPNGELKVTTIHDFSEAISKLAKFGTVSMYMYEMVLTTDEGVDLSFVQEASVGFIKADGTIEPLATKMDVVEPTSIVFDIFNQSSEMQKAMQAGPFRLRVSGKASSPPVNFTPKFRVCSSLKADVHSSVSDIK